MKFFNLLKKEVKELITPEMLISLVMTMLIFMILGNVMTNTIEEATKQEYKVSISDNDKTDFTAELIETMKNSGADVKVFETSGDDYAEILDSTGQKNIIIIPKGFTEAVENGEKPEIISISGMESASAMSNISNTNSGGLNFINSYISAKIAEKAGVSQDELENIENPVSVNENTVVNGKYASVSTDSVMSKIMTQNMILPIIIFVLITMTSQTLMSSISNEKIDKTLETLLSAPVSRGAILGAKMLAAAVVALLNAVFYMVGFSKFVSGATEQTTAQINVPEIMGSYVSVDDAIKQLGLTLSPSDYILVGIQLFVTIMICLCVSLILGALVNDTKSAQTMIMPLLMMAMIPYIISMVTDINSLPIVIRMIVYAIPFTHTFSAIPNIMFGHTSLFFAGLAYQAVVFAVCMFFALRLFNSDKILTISLNFGQKSKYKKKNKSSEE